MSRKACKKCSTPIPQRDAVVVTSKHETFWFCSVECFRLFFALGDMKYVGRFPYYPGGDR